MSEGHLTPRNLDGESQFQEKVAGLRAGEGGSFQVLLMTCGGNCTAVISQIRWQVTATDVPNICGELITPLVNKICDAESHFVQISSDLLLLEELNFLDHLDPLGLKHSLMGSQEHCKMRAGAAGEEDQEEEKGQKQ